MVRLSSAKNNIHRQKRQYTTGEPSSVVPDAKAESTNDSKVSTADNKKCNCAKSPISDKCPSGPPGPKGVTGYNGEAGLPGTVCLILTVLYYLIYLIFRMELLVFQLKMFKLNSLNSINVSTVQLDNLVIFDNFLHLKINLFF